MAFDREIYEILAQDVASLPDISEKRMFGGVAFMMHGNMLCGAHSGGAMYRVGKPNEAAALAIEGVAPMAFTGRKMGGFVDASFDVMEDPERREAVLELALSIVATLPAK